jgi:integrase-like protein
MAKRPAPPDSTAARIATVFRVHIDPILGHLPMAQVRPSHLRAWVKNRSAVLAPSTLAVAYSYLTALFNRAGRKPFLGPVKTKTSVRTVELPEVTAVALAWHIKNYPPIETEIDDLVDARNPRHRTAKLVFLRSTLNPIDRADWAHIWAPARDAAGIPKGTGLHCFRHYFATLLIHNGASVKTVQMALATPPPPSRSTPTWGSGPNHTRRPAAWLTAPWAVCPRCALRRSPDDEAPGQSIRFIDSS